MATLFAFEDVRAALRSLWRRRVSSHWSLLVLSGALAASTAIMTVASLGISEATTVSGRGEPRLYQFAAQGCVFHSSANRRRVLGQAGRLFENFRRFAMWAHGPGRALF